MAGPDDAARLIACAEAGLVLVAFDRATPPWHAGRVLRAGESHEANYPENNRRISEKIEILCEQISRSEQSISSR